MTTALDLIENNLINSVTLIKYHNIELIGATKTRALS